MIEQKRTFSDVVRDELQQLHDAIREMHLNEGILTTQAAVDGDAIGKLYHGSRQEAIRELADRCGVRL